MSDSNAFDAGLGDNAAGKETELKFCFDADQLDRVTSFFTDNDSAQHRRQLSTTYFDTADGALRDRGLALRVRRDGEHFIQTIKGRDEGIGGALHRREIEAPIQSTRPNLDAIDDPEIATTLRESTLTGLKPVFRVEVERLSIGPIGNRADVAVDIDVGKVSAGRRRSAIYEIEIESKGGPVGVLYDLALQLHHEVPVRISKVSKSDTGYLLFAGEEPGSKKGKKPDLDPEITTEQSLSRIMQACLDQLIANEPCVSRTKNPEGIHQMRVALRRMRSILRLFRDLLPEKRYNDTVAELRWLANALGPARDWDVFSTEIVGPVLDHMPDHNALSTLKRRADSRRSRCRKTAQEAVASPRFTELALRLSAWIASPSWHPMASPEVSARLAEPATNFATQALRKRFKRVRKLASRIKQLSVEQRHELRIEVKKLRYTIAFFGRLFDRTVVKPFSKQLGSLQDDLGYLNDVAVAEALTAEITLSARPQERTLLQGASGLLVGWHGHAVFAHEDDLVRDVEALLAAEPFWEPTEG